MRTAAQRHRGGGLQVLQQCREVSPQPGLKAEQTGESREVVSRLVLKCEVELERVRKAENAVRLMLIVRRKKRAEAAAAERASSAPVQNMDGEGGDGEEVVNGEQEKVGSDEGDDEGQDSVVSTDDIMQTQGPR